MIQFTRIATELQSVARLPGEVARAAAAGLGTGGKAVANGLVTAVKDVATLGLSPGQLELIGVNKEDRDRGYDTAVSISTASGQVLIAVGTGGMASALSKGGSIARHGQWCPGRIRRCWQRGRSRAGRARCHQERYHLRQRSTSRGRLTGLASKCQNSEGFSATPPTREGSPKWMNL